MENPPHIDEIILGEIYKIKCKEGYCLAMITHRQKLYKKEHKAGYYYTTRDGVYGIYKFKLYEMQQINPETMEPLQRRAVLYLHDEMPRNSFLRTYYTNISGRRTHKHLFITECKLYSEVQDAALCAMKNAAADAEC